MATYNDAWENVEHGNVALADNSRFTYTKINEINWRTGEYNIVLSSGVAVLDLTDLTKKGYIRFKDGSYVECELTDMSTLHKVFYLKNDDGTFTPEDLGYTAIDTNKSTINEPGGPELITEVITYGYSIGVYLEPGFNGYIQEFGCPLTSGVRATKNVMWSFESEEGHSSYNTIRNSFLYVIQKNENDIIDFLASDLSPATSYPGDNSDTGGGDGSFFAANYTIPIPALPTVQAIDFGFVSIYNPSSADLRQLSAWLWSDNFTNNIKKNYTSPFENILAISLVPLNLSGTNTEFVIGNVGSNIQIPKLSTQYIELDCGTININEYWGSFLDYNATYAIYLPYIGYRSLRPDDLVNGSINVVYHIDLLTGSATCFIGTTKEDNIYHVLYTYSCNIFYSIPFSGANYMTMYNQQLSATASGINNAVQSLGRIASGDLIGGASSLLTGQALAKRQYDTAKPDYGRGGNLSGNGGFFSIRYPYIIQALPIGQTPKNYKQYNGIPSMICYTLSQLVGKGYTEIDTVIVDTLNSCTSDEKSEILNILKGGVIL